MTSSAFKCNLRRIQSPKSDAVTVSALRHLQVETEQSVKETDSVTLTCKSSCSLPQQTTFIWFRNTQRLTEESRKTLYLPSVTFSDSGNYRCAVSGEEHLKSPPVYLQVRWGGQQYWGVIYSPSYICALKGSTVTLSCSLTHTGYYKLSKAFWTKTAVTDGEPTNLCSDPVKRGSVQCVSDYKYTYNITWTSVTEADKHIYYCRFRDGQYKGWTVIPGARLDVTDLQVETEQSVKETDSVTLTCKSSCSLPQQTTFIWFRNTQRLTEESRKTLYLPSVTFSDSGNYRCAVSGEEHLKSPPVYLQVRYPPKSVSVSISPSEIVEGDSVTLICSSDSNPPALNFSWFKDNQSSAVGSGQSFIISSFNSSHSGRYYCEAQNQHGSQRSASVSVSVKDSPISPLSLFGDSVNTVVKRFREVKNNEEAFVQFLPCRSQREGSSATQPHPGPSKASERIWQRGNFCRAWVLSPVWIGYKIQFIRHPPHFNGVVYTYVKPELMQVLFQDLQTVLGKEAIEHVPLPRRESGYYSRYFLVPKMVGDCIQSWIFEA
ncbi:B-cell receptor CD22-like [Carassius auratus]|uniref:B-cell receptor CD22-like n=1 Tax=Carassius auratus TaxID=7957 RepID=A0A6P6N2D8_CARAU|nr:B-cell receptor CD22-like [Carassius auratus]